MDVQMFFADFILVFENPDFVLWERLTLHLPVYAYSIY